MTVCDSCVCACGGMCACACGMHAVSGVVCVVCVCGVRCGGVHAVQAHTKALRCKGSNTRCAAFRKTVQVRSTEHRSDAHTYPNTCSSTSAGRVSICWVGLNTKTSEKCKHKRHETKRNEMTNSGFIILIFC